MEINNEQGNDIMLVRFLSDYRGVLTGEQFFEAGQIHEFDGEAAQALIDAGRAEDVVVPMWLGGSGLLDIAGVSHKLAAQLAELGYEYAAEIALADAYDLVGIPGIGEAKAKKIIKAAQVVVAE